MISQHIMTSTISTAILNFVAINNDTGQSAPKMLFSHPVVKEKDCTKKLHDAGLPLDLGIDKEGRPSCKSVYDGFLCWPSVPANTTASMSCPRLRGLLANRNATRTCDELGNWKSKDNTQDNSSDNGWTNFTACLMEDITKMLRTLSPDNLKKAQQVAVNARYIDFVGLVFSLVSLIIAIIIFSKFKRLHVFRNRIHRQLMIVMLCNVILRLLLYCDMAYGRGFASWIEQSDVKMSIHSTHRLCESFYFMLEYLKSVAFAFMFIEGYYLHSSVVVQVFAHGREPSILRYAAFGYGVSVVNVAAWIAVLSTRAVGIQLCLGDYYIQAEYWVVNSVRLGMLVINIVFLVRVGSVVWSVVRVSQSPSESAQIKKSVKGGLMLIMLLGIPNIMQTIPFMPSDDTMLGFTIFTYCASFVYMFQGFFITVLYCFTNPEVIAVLRSHWGRYRLTHTTADKLRRSSRATSFPFYATQATQLTMGATNGVTITRRSTSIPLRFTLDCHENSKRNRKSSRWSLLGHAFHTINSARQSTQSTLSISPSTAVNGQRPWLPVDRTYQNSNGFVHRLDSSDGEKLNFLPFFRNTTGIIKNPMTLLGPDLSTKKYEHPSTVYYLPTSANQQERQNIQIESAPLM